MGEIHAAMPALPLVAVSSRYDDALAWAAVRCASELGHVALKSDAFDFQETEYYRATMGVGLKKQFLALEPLIDPATLPRLKTLTNTWEAACATELDHPEPRPLNLDPGYLTQAKLVLASTKDHAHRIYLGEGIYGEVTLNYRGGHWRPLAWTYPDYRREDYHGFFLRCRDLLRRLAAGN